MIYDIKITNDELSETTELASILDQEESTRRKAFQVKIILKENYVNF